MEKDNQNKNEIKHQETKTYDLDETDPQKEQSPMKMSQPQQLNKKVETSNTESQSKAKTQQYAHSMPQEAELNRLSFKDFEVRKELGSGSYSEVYLCKRKEDKGKQGKYSALKCIDRTQIEREQKSHHVFVEKEVLFSFPDKKVVNLYSSFKDKDYFYLEIEYCKNGEFAKFLKSEKKLPLNTAKFFAAECLLIQEFLHENGIAHRDFKPENLMLDEKNHLKVIDFGTAAFFETSTNKSFYKRVMSILKSISYTDSNDNSNYTAERQSFVGTVLYMCPEMVSNSQCGPEGDFWALGVLIYQMLTKEYPFDGNNIQLYEMIQNIQIKYPDSMDSNAKDLIGKILKVNPKERLGCGPKGSSHDLDAQKNHPFFAGIDWENLYDQPSPVKATHKVFSSGFGDELVAPQKPQILKTGLVRKMKMLIFYNTRQLILYNNGMLAYFNPENNEKRGEIHLNKECKTRVKRHYTFELETKSRTFIFNTDESCAEDWVKIINSEIKRLF